MTGFGTELVEDYITKFQRVIQNENTLHIDKISDQDINERRVFFAAAPFPSEISDIYCDIGVGGDITNITYIEEWGDNKWGCRWDRHENPHNTYDHFHCPPDAVSKKADGVVVDADYPQGVLVMETVGTFIADRYYDLITGDSISYPVDYQWEDQYGDDVYQ